MSVGYDSGWRVWVEDDYCRHCGVNPATSGDLCGVCRDEDDFLNCSFCNGTSCTGECDDEEDDLT